MHTCTREEVARAEAMAKRMRLHALEMAVNVGRAGAHLGGSLSCMEIYAVLYGIVLRRDPENPLWEGRDRFIAGKEHARLAEYPALCEAGFFPKEVLLAFENDGSPLAGHVINPDIGIEYSSCSLGMALSFAVGMALEARRIGKRYRIYVLLGDGECCEGAIWEAIQCAAHFRLSNLTLIVDRNRLTVDGDTECLLSLGDLGKKLLCFGWSAKSIDGHDIRALAEALLNPKLGRPNAVIAETIKGKGVSFMEGRKEWHQKSLTRSLFELAKAEISCSAGKIEDD